MKRSNILEEKQEIGYNMDLSQVYEVTFNKDFGAFKSGEKTYVGLPIAMKWVSLKVVSLTPEISEAAEKYGCSKLLKSDKIK